MLEVRNKVHMHFNSVSKENIASVCTYVCMYVHTVCTYSMKSSTVLPHSEVITYVVQ